METKIERIGYKKEKERDVKSQAKRCINDHVGIKDLSEHLSNQMFEDAPTLYLNPTERLHISNLVIPNEAFATVLAGADFAIDAAFHGANKILTFDINSNQYYPAALKIKALQNMSYDEYIAFLINNSNKYHLSPEIYTELKRRAERDQNLYAYMDEIMSAKKQAEQHVRSGLRKITNGNIALAYQMGLDLDGMSECELEMAMSMVIPGFNQSAFYRTFTGTGGHIAEDSYLENNDSYDKAVERVKNSKISFLKTDVTKLKTELEKHDTDFDKFGSIYLSNIPEYLTKTEFMKALNEELMPLLTDNGVIAYCIQATNIKTLTASEDEINKIKQKLERGSIGDLLIKSQLTNSIDIFNELQKEYKIDYEEIKTLAKVNGINENDTFVYIKKK